MAKNEQDLTEAFEVLKLDPTLDLQVVKAQFRKQALQLHPDKCVGGEEKFKAASEAYQTICKHIQGEETMDENDPDLRLHFDLMEAFKNHILTQMQSSQEPPPGGYASGGSSCEGSDAGSQVGDSAYDAESDDETIDENADEDDEEGGGNDDNSDGSSEEGDESSDWGPRTPAVDGKSTPLPIHAHHCPPNHHGICKHGIVPPVIQRFTELQHFASPEDIEALRKRELQHRLEGKKRPETDAERKLRVKMLLHEQQLAQERRESELKAKKAAALKAKEQEQKEAAARRAQKNARKRAARLDQAAQAKSLAEARALQAQQVRSDVFDRLEACAKTHNDEAFYEAVSGFKELLVASRTSVTGWERLPDLKQPADSTGEVTLRGTTLLHLATQASDPELVGWLYKQGARPDERDEDGFTAFHKALANGDKPLLDYFFETFPPFTSDGEENATNLKIFNPVDGTDVSKSLIMLATSSGDAETVDYVLDRCTIAEVEQCYKHALLNFKMCRGDPMAKKAWSDVMAMLRQKEGFYSPRAPFARRYAPFRPGYVDRKNGTKTAHAYKSLKSQVSA